MAQDIQPQVPQHLSSPTTRELRSQSVHRLQVGLFGLCAMLLLVGLANIIMDRARLAEELDPTAVETPAAQGKGASDPLADLGVVPAADPSTPAAAAPARK